MKTKNKRKILKEGQGKINKKKTKRKRYTVQRETNMRMTEFSLKTTQVRKYEEDYTELKQNKSKQKFNL